MNTTLAALLETYAPTYYDVLPASTTHGITYTLFSCQDDPHESGEPLGERIYYMIRLFQATYSETEIRALRAALRAAGYGVGSRTTIKNAELGYFQHNFEITKWGVIT